MILTMIHAIDINAFMHASGSLEKMFKAFCYISIYIYKIMSSLGVVIYDPMDFIWINLNLFVLEMIHAKYCPIWHSSSWEEDFLSFSLYITVKV